MSYDAIITGAICHELRGAIAGGRVQHVHHPDELSIALEIYSRPKTHWLFLSAHPQGARVHLMAERPSRTTDRVTPLLLLLRKYVDGARVESVDRPPLERVLRLGFARRAPSGEVWHTELVAEIMGRLSNLILLDADGSVMDALKRVTPAINRVRTVLPRHRYDPPPPQDKLDPRTITPAALARALERPAKSLAGALVAGVDACSPLLAREVVCRAHGRTDLPVAEADTHAVTAAFNAIWRDAEAQRFAPSVALEDGQIVAFAAYELASFPHVEPVPSISAAVERFFAQHAAGPKAPADEARRRSLRAALLVSQDQLRGKLYSLRQSLVAPAEVERLRVEGERLLTETKIVEAQQVFERYAKAKSAARDVPAMIERAEHELRYLAEAQTMLDLAATPDELTALRAEWAELGYLSGVAASSRAGRAPHPRRRGRAAPPGPAGFRRVSVEGFDVLVGRSGRGNDVLLAREARPNDVWLHARGVPGAHVIVRTGGRELPERVLRRAAALAAGQSQARTAPTVGVDYTLCRYVDRVRGGPPGLANYRGERTLHVAPESLVDLVTGT